MAVRDDERAELLAIMGRFTEPVTVEALADATGISTFAVRYHLQLFEQHGRVCCTDGKHWQLKEQV